MKSIVVMTIIAIFTISSDAATVYDNFDLLASDNYGRCPTVETADVEVMFIGSDLSKVKSCATFKFRTHDETPEVKSFKLRFNRSNNGALRPCASSDDLEMENFVFPCMSTSSTEDGVQVNGYFDNVLFGRIINVSGKQEIRCAIYKMVSPTKYLIAVSSDKSCISLPQMLSDLHVDAVTYWLMRPDEINLRRIRSTSDTKSSIKNFSGSRFFWRTG